MNKEERKEYMKRYREENKEYLTKYNKLYHKHNRIAINRSARIKIQCECGSMISKTVINRHRKTAKHINNISKLN